MKIFLKNIHLLNFLLIALIGIFAHYLFLLSHTIESMNPLPSAQQSREAGEETVTEIEIPSSAEYTVVADENLFHPERKIPVEKKEDQSLPKPDFVLYGILITDDMRIAYMEDLKAPRSTAGRGKRTTALKKGDVMSGYTLSEVYHDRIAMVRDTDRIEVNVLDPNKKQRSSVAVTASGKPTHQAAVPQQPIAIEPVTSPSSSPKTRGGQRPASAVQRVPSTPGSGPGVRR